MDIRQLRYFTAIVEEGTLTGACQTFKYDPASPYCSAEAFRRGAEVPLFSPGMEKRLHLTEAGHHFYERAQRILGMCDAAVTENGRFSGRSNGNSAYRSHIFCKGSALSQVDLLLLEKVSQHPV